ncbi:hypothetical protein [Curtobacterium sp. MCBA15_012]|uniref:hypothetical protein n=1 Tax=Curtobacterium sp. MCBA15_012 TaxID=1898738 RepID=UPI0008DD96AB|nr:hypothetical protein [Curtobacterium sp. MCBA15_012]WIA99712.1 hypothetical protein QOL15_14555 [Curtobacterium sp. MCBA15_012]
MSTQDIARMDTGEIVSYEPVTPLELEFMIRELGERLERAVPVMKGLYKARYDAERALIEEKAKAVLRSGKASVTEKRAEADLETMTFRRDVDAAKETLHAAEELQKALAARLMGLQNINKVLGQAYGASPR